MHTGESNEPSCWAVDYLPSRTPALSHRSAITLGGLGVVFCLIGLTMACNPTVVETMQGFRASFHKMLAEPATPYNFAQAAAVFYLVPGSLMIGLACRRPTISRSLSSFFGTLMISIVLVRALFGRPDTFLLFQLLVGVALLYYGYSKSKPASLNGE